MSREIWTSTALALLLAGGLAAEEPATRESESASESAQPARRKIRVLEDPYDISSFYRSSEGAAYGYGFFGYDREGSLRATDRYPIAGFYRSTSRDSYGYWRANAWRRSPLRTRRQRRGATRISDFYLLVPTVLAPVTPLAGDREERVDAR
jgi:hypothetical protein